MLRERPEISVAELAQAFDSSQATIRRDLRVLDMNGLLRRTYGGALSSEQVLFEPTVRERAAVESNAKRAMGRYAVDHLIKDGNVVLLDAGSSIGELVRELSQSRLNLTIITNSIPHASVLGRMPTVRLYMLGGEFRVATDACTGSWAEQMLATIRADVAFLGVNGIDLKDGLTTPTIEDAHVKRAMIWRPEKRSFSPIIRSSAAPRSPLSQPLMRSILFLQMPTHRSISESRSNPSVSRSSAANPAEPRLRQRRYLTARPNDNGALLSTKRNSETLKPETQ